MSKLFNLKKIFKMSSLIMMAILCTLSLTSHESYAATGYQGYAVYRNGVILPVNLQWHAGLMDEPSSTKFDPVVHHSGSGYVKWDSWANFLDGNQFQAVYKPKSNPTSARRDAYVAMGRRLKDEQISYTFTYQIYYDSYTTPTYVYPKGNH